MVTIPEGEKETEDMKMNRKEIEEMITERIRRGLPLHGWMLDIAIEIALEEKENQENA